MGVCPPSGECHSLCLSSVSQPCLGVWAWGRAGGHAPPLSGRKTAPPPVFPGMLHGIGYLSLWQVSYGEEFWQRLG